MAEYDSDDPLDFDDDDTEEVGGGVLGALAGPWGEVSAEEQELPQDYAEQLKIGRELLGKTAGALTAFERQHQQALAAKRAAIQQGLDRLLARQPDYTATLLAAASGFLKPTRTGSFWESLGAAGEGAVAPLTREQDKTEARSLKALEYQLGLAGVEGEAAKAALTTALERGKLGRGLTTDVLKLNQQRLNQLSRQAGAKALADYRAEQQRGRTARDIATAAHRDRQLRLQKLRLEQDEQTPESRNVAQAIPIEPGWSPEEKAQALRDRRELLKRLLTQAKDKPVEAPEETPEERAALAEALGVPLAAVDPLRRIPAGSKRNEAQVRLLTQGQKEIEDEQPKVTELTGLAQQAERFIDLNRRVSSGLKYKVPLSEYTSDEAQEMQAIVSQVTPGMRSGMPGAASDRDVAMFREAAFGLTKAPEVNRNIASGFIAAAKNAKERLSFRSAYLQVNSSLIGAEAAWQEYLNANPIFDPSAPATDYRLNSKRQSWGSYFRGRKQSAAPRREVIDVPNEALVP